MTTHGLVLAFAIGSALIAVWIYHRRPARMPRTGRQIVVHALAALAATALVPLLMKAAATEHSPARAMLALLVLVLPMFVYNFLTWLWLLKLLQRRLRVG
jgi:uncharacterized membrane protein